MPNKLATIDKKVLLKLYKSGKTQTEVAKYFDVTQSVICNHMKKLGILARSKAPKKEFGKLNRNWKGKKVKYAGLHARQYRNYEKTGYCQNKDCKKEAKTEWAKIDRDYTTTKNFVELCISCHRNYDLGKLALNLNTNTNLSDEELVAELERRGKVKQGKIIK